MPGLSIIVDGDGCWPDLKTNAPLHGELEAVALLRGGMQSGAPSVSLRVKLDDGRVVIAETSLMLFEGAAKGLRSGLDARTGVETWTPSKLGIPTTKEEYDQRFAENVHASGYGFDKVAQHYPCPFCASPEWRVLKIIDHDKAQPERICNECGRGAKMLYAKAADGSATLEVVQTRGDDPPAWIPKMRRVEVAGQ